MICPNCGRYVQEKYYTGGVILQCSYCGFYQMLPYVSQETNTI